MTNKTGDSKKVLTPPKHPSYPPHINNLEAKDSADNILYLQRAIGNQAVQRLINSDKVGFDFAKIGILQPKLKVSQPNDVYEQEADRVAEQVMRMTDPSGLVVPQGAAIDEERIGRKCAACKMEEEEEKEKEDKELQISRKHSTSRDTSSLEANDKTTNEIIDIRASNGSSLDANTGEFMMSRFGGYDFSNVKVHTDKRATRSAHSVNALAYTVGNDIVFGEGQYQPGTLEGRKLLAHELTHVIQGGGMIQRQPGPVDDRPMNVPSEDAEALAKALEDDFYSFYNLILHAQIVPNYTSTRQEIITKLDSWHMPEIFAGGLLENPLNHLDQIIKYTHELGDLRFELNNKNEQTKRLMTELEKKVKRENERLAFGTLEEQTALGILNNTHSKTIERLVNLGSAAVPEDLNSLSDMLNNKRHITFGAEQVKRENEQIQIELAQFSDEMKALSASAGSGLSSDIWSIVGWESVEDFATDTLITIATLGTGKLFKLAKGARKVRAASKVRRAALAARHAKRIQKLEKLAKAAVGLVDAIKDHEEEMTKIFLWIKANGKSIAKKIATDLAADFTTGNLKESPRVAVNRLTKQRIQDLVDTALDSSPELVHKYVELAVFAGLAGKESTKWRLIQGALMISTTRRGLTNLIQQVVLRTGRLDIPKDLKSIGIDLANIAITTAGEVIEDMFLSHPVINKFKDHLAAPIEWLRKSIVGAIQNVLTSTQIETGSG
jgi:hypothetical protein